MARSTILLLALLAALVLAASARREYEEDRGSSCERQVERLNLRHCERHIMQRIQQQQQEEEGEEEEEEEYLRMRGVGSYLRRSQAGNLKQRCCNQLRELEEKPRCMCKALQQIYENQSEELQRGQKQQAERELRNLPRSCGFQPPRRCDVRQDD